MTPADWRPDTTGLIIGCFLIVGLAAAAVLPLWLGLVSLIACAYGAFIAYGRQVYIDYINGKEII